MALSRGTTASESTRCACDRRSRQGGNTGVQLPHQREAETCGPTSMAAGGRTELLANPTRRAQSRCPPVRRVIALLVAAARPGHERRAGCRREARSTAGCSPAVFLIVDSCDFGVFYEEVRVSGTQTMFFNADGEVTKVDRPGQLDRRAHQRRTLKSRFGSTSPASSSSPTTDFTAHGRNLLCTSFPEPFMVLTVGNSSSTGATDSKYAEPEGTDRGYVRPPGRLGPR